MNKYYSTFISPKSIAELRELNIIPKQEWYENVSDIYISHMHLDHMGALSNIPNPKTIVHLPNIQIYEDMKEKWELSPTWLSLIPNKYYTQLKQLTPLETDRNNVMAISVSHSAYPSYAFIYFGKNENVLYTGDFRIESFLNNEEFYKLNNSEPLLNFLNNNKDLKIDTLIIEGTNIGSNRLPLEPKETLNIINKLAKNYNKIITTTHALDIEYAYALMKIATELNMNFYIASAQTAKLLENIPELPLKPKLIEEYTNYISFFEKITLNEINEKSFILVPYRDIINFIKDVSLTGMHIKDYAIIISEPEPQTEEAIEYDIMSNWFSRMGIQSYRIRPSGHYYPYQLKTILNTIKPKNIKVLHTEKPQLFQKIIENYTK
jgi:ribonuclease J